MSQSDTSARTVGPAVVIGSALEWYDFYLFASMAALVFGKVFFPGQSSVAGTLASIATFTVGFVVRPLSGIFFGYVGDKIGRKRVLSLTFLLMGVSSGLIGLIPSYGSIGVFAPILLVVLRLGQGLGAGAEFGSAVAVSYEHAGARTRGRFGSLPALGVNIGLFAASLTVAVLTSLDREFLETWGWRIPFVASFALVGVGYWVRTRMPETPEFARVADDDDRRTHATPLRDLLRHHWRGVGAVGLVTIGYLSASYLFKTFSLSYLTEFRGVPANVGAFGVTLASAVAIAAVPVAGWLCDRYDAARVLLVGAAGIALIAFPFFWALDTGAPLAIWAVLIASTGIIIPAMLAASGAYFARQFPTSVRASGLGTGKETGGIAGGLAPLLGFALITVTPGHAYWPVSLMFLVSAFAVVAGARWDQRKRLEHGGAVPVEPHGAGLR
ncbi:MFS transporter [Pseudonocardia eucalypti]|uniref:MFS transporter n=1 Tax=Pseudonocardia eucalypti TaxID=648755 RepID=A0ABP9PLR4_9PSEU|nr:MFS family permease [Pseudonocardia eucalypti]